MELFLAVTNTEAVAWACFIVGLALALTGSVIGLVISLGKTPQNAKDKIEEAKGKIEEAKTSMQTAAQPGLESTVAAGTAQAAASTAEEAKSALEQVQGIVGALPENLRFAGVLVLVGVGLMSVATIQFGGVSLF
jgi:hypothetical protein